MYTEKSPLTGGQPTYSYQNPSRLYKKQVKQFQCLLCAAVLALFAMALITAVVFSVEEDDLDMLNQNTSLQGKLQAAPGSPTKPTKPPKPIKLYTSGTVVKGTASGGFDGEETNQVFNGKLPVTIHLDPIIDPNAWSPSVDITWSGVVVNNNTVKGTFSLPVRVPINGTESEEVKTFKGQFEMQLAFKWSSNLDIIIPNKVYNCKAIFLAAYKSSMTEDPGDVAIATTKGKTDALAETCNVMFQGSFYERSFFCYVTPWWCTNEKLFYWNGGLEFKITKPAPQPTNPPPVNTTPNSLNSIKKDSSDRPILNSALNAMPGDAQPVIVGAKILGAVANGWVTIQDDSGASKTVWNGGLPVEIPLSFLASSNNGMKESSSETGLTWSCSVFSNSLRGNFKLPQYNELGAPTLVKGSFFFLLESNPSTALNSALVSGVEYSSTLGFRDSNEVFNGTQIIDFISRNSSDLSVILGYKAPIIILGKVNKVTKTFMWDGRFEMIPKRISKDSNTVLKSTAEMPADAEPVEPMPVLGSSLKAWPVREPIGSKLIGKVSSGWVTLDDDSGTKTIWGGQLPAPITVPMFFNPTTNVSDLSDEYGHGVTWSCSVFHSALRGTFRLPQYTMFGLVKWMKGSFFFQLDSDPSWSLYDAIYPGVSYNSPIHFRNSEQPYNGSKLVQFYSYNSWEPMDDLGYKAIFILLGKSDKLSKSFSWDGRFEMIVKKDYKNMDNALEKSSSTLNRNQLHSATKRPSPVLHDKEMASLNSLDLSIVGSKLLGKVASGWISLTDDSGTTTIWNGELPARISFPMFFDKTNNMSGLSDEYGHGIVWSSSVFHSTIKGSFKLPQYTKFGLVKWLKGSFSFQLESSPNWSLYDAVMPGINYYSPIHFRPTKKEFNDTQLINFYASSQTSPMDDLGFKAPIVLLGESKGKGFSWDGRFLIVIKKLY